MMRDSQDTAWTLPLERALRDLDARLAYDYDLPEELVAAHPSEQRGGSRMMIVDRDSGDLRHAHYSQLPELLGPHDHLIFNDSRVIAARLLARKPTGGAVEFFALQRLDAGGRWEAPSDEGPLRLEGLVRSSRGLRPDQLLQLRDQEDAPALRVTRYDAGQAEVAIETPLSAQAFLEQHGELPLPPYILKRREAMGQQAAAQQEDRERYQTVYARAPGAVAAPTAGLHFTPALLEQLRQAGVQMSFVTLHVGAGTFRPVSQEQLSSHAMHSEDYHISEQASAQLRDSIESGRRIIAVGTTSARVLESEARLPEPFLPGARSTSLFLRPGGQAFVCAQGLITNLHLPCSTLLALVARFAGYAQMREIYDEAIAQRYRFYSYGDGMLIL